MHVDKLWSRANVIARSVSLLADGRSLFAAVAPRKPISSCSMD